MDIILLCMLQRWATLFCFGLAAMWYTSNQFCLHVEGNPEHTVPFTQFARARVGKADPVHTGQELVCPAG